SGRRRRGDGGGQRRGGGRGPAPGVPRRAAGPAGRPPRAQTARPAERPPVPPCPAEPAPAALAAHAHRTSSPTKEVRIMRFAKSWRPVTLLAAMVACILALGACSARSLGSSDEEGRTTLTFLVDNADASVKPAQALAEAFHAKNPDITVQVQTRPGGSEGDNIVKTRLSTGEMTNVFLYNSGSLFQALNPKQNLTPVTGEAWASQVEDAFKPVVSVDKELYGPPITGASAGGILYNRKVFEQLGLQVPKTWAQFMANNAKIKAAGIDPVIQTYQDTWTSQLFVLADFHNVAAADPGWAEKYTAGQVKYAQEPA